MKLLFSAVRMECKMKVEWNRSKMQQKDRGWEFNINKL